VNGTETRHAVFAGQTNNSCVLSLKELAEKAFTESFDESAKQSDILQLFHAVTVRQLLLIALKFTRSHLING
jgi:hypothetical protein